MKASAVVASAWFVFTFAFAGEPLTFKGFAIGATKADVLANYPAPSARCESSGLCVWQPERDCSAAGEGSPRAEQCKALTYAGLYPKLLILQFKDEKLVSAVVTFSEAQFKSVKAAMLDRYGQPQDTSVETLQNRMGATFESERLAWHDGSAILMLKQRAGRVDQSSASLTGKAYLKDFQEQQEQNARARSKDL